MVSDHFQMFLGNNFSCLFVFWSLLSEFLELLTVFLSLFLLSAGIQDFNVFSRPEAISVEVLRKSGIKVELFHF